MSTPSFTVPLFCFSNVCIFCIAPDIFQNRKALPSNVSYSISIQTYELNSKDRLWQLKMHEIHFESWVTRDASWWIKWADLYNRFSFRITKSLIWSMFVTDFKRYAAGFHQRKYSECMDRTSSSTSTCQRVYHWTNRLQHGRTFTNCLQRWK